MHRTLIVLILKLYMGGFRPHFFDVCKPNATLLNEQVAYSVQNYTSLYFNSTICTGNKRMVKNALVIHLRRPSNLADPS
jgi:hypothetical protein